MSEKPEMLEELQELKRLIEGAIQAVELNLIVDRARTDRAEPFDIILGGEWGITKIRDTNFPRAQARLFNGLTANDWTTEDWSDLYRTMEQLKARVMERHGLDIIAANIRANANEFTKLAEKCKSP